jgi:methyl-accepting chemotaxis protein
VQSFYISCTKTTLDKTKASSNEIGGIIKELAAEIKSSSAQIDLVNESNAAVTSFANKTVRTMEETTSYLQEITCSTEDQTNLVDKLSSLSTSLDGVVDELHNSIEKFKL